MKPVVDIDTILCFLRTDFIAIGIARDHVFVIFFLIQVSCVTRARKIQIHFISVTVCSFDSTLPTTALLIVVVVNRSFVFAHHIVNQQETTI